MSILHQSKWLSTYLFLGVYLSKYAWQVKAHAQVFF